MTKTLTVTCHHLEGELMRVRFANSQVVSDHPIEAGGEGTGPSPGILLQMALASATVLAGRRYADQHGLAMATINTRTSMGMRAEGFAPGAQGGPLAKLHVIDRFWRLVEIEGRLNEEELAGLQAEMANAPVVKAIREGFAIDESLSCVPIAGPRGDPATKNPWHLRDDITARLKDGDVRVMPAPENWRVSATALDAHSCLAKAAGSLYSVGHSLEDMCGPTPEELLLGGLGACTTVYVARNAALLEIPLQSVSVSVSARYADDGQLDLSSVEKVTRVAGNLSESEISDLDHIAFHCALGESLKRGVLMADQVQIVSNNGDSISRSPLSALMRDAPKPDDNEFCDDGSCCAPEPMQTSR